ncbi:MAG TPA: hypothetical protein VN598_10450 [Usitatibacter sp.]|nr:hypothetical protein [Usitatibacter sp.]
MKTVHFGDEGQRATAELVRRFESLAPLQLAAYRTTHGHVHTLQALDKQYGGMAVLELEDLASLVGGIHTQLAHWEAEAARRKLAAAEAIAEVTIGVALWAIRHGIALDVVEPVVNALAWRSNHAQGKAELAAIYALTRGVIAHVAPRLAPDLERSNPERAWRMLHANLAITAIRTEDAAAIDAAFDMLDEALPDERGSFYAEARALALAPGIAPAVRERIEARCAKWT